MGVKLYLISFSLVTALAFLSFFGSDSLADSTTFPEDTESPELSANSTSDLPIKAKAVEFQQMLQSLETPKDTLSSSSLTQDHDSIPSKIVPIQVTEESSPQPFEEVDSLVLQEEGAPVIAEENLLNNKPLALDASEKYENSATRTTPLTLWKEDTPSLAQKPSPQNELIPPKEKLPLDLKSQNLPKVDVHPHPTVQPLAEESLPPPQEEAPKASISFMEAVKEREPLGLLEANENPSAKKWYLYASAKRGINSPSDVIDIISVEGEGASSLRATDIKNLLLGMGLKPNQIRVIRVKGDESQTGKVYLFGEK